MSPEFQVVFTVLSFVGNSGSLAHKESYSKYFFLLANYKYTHKANFEIMMLIKNLVQQKGRYGGASDLLPTPQPPSHSDDHGFKFNILS